MVDQYRGLSAKLKKLSPIFDGITEIGQEEHEGDEDSLVSVDLRATVPLFPPSFPNFIWERRLFLAKFHFALS